jgi:hypothetical protein
MAYISLINNTLPTVLIRQHSTIGWILMMQWEDIEGGVLRPGLLYKPTFEPQTSQREAEVPTTLHSLDRTVSKTSYTETAWD